MAKSSAADLLIKLSTDPALRSRFQANPGAILDEAGIHGDERDALLSGDPERVRGHLGNDAPPGCLVLFTATDES